MPTSDTTLDERKEKVLAEVSILETLSLFGVETSGNKRIRCIYPEHNDRHPAMAVYTETNRVYCFACAEGSDVIGVVMRCSKPGTVLPMEEAIEWLEGKFGLSAVKTKEDLLKRVRSKIKKWKEVEEEPESDATAEMLVMNTFDQVWGANSKNSRLFFLEFEDYIWSECDKHKNSQLEWAAWARGMILGYYAKSLEEFDLWWYSPELRKERYDRALDLFLLEDTHSVWSD